MKYEVWLNARHPKTLESVASMRVFAHDDRLKAEAIAETAQADFGGPVNLLRIWQPGAVVNSEVRTAGHAFPATKVQTAILLHLAVHTSLDNQVASNVSRDLTEGLRVLLTGDES